MGAVAWAMRQRSVSHPRSSNRTCRSPASGSPTGFIARRTEKKPWPQASSVQQRSLLRLTVQLSLKGPGHSRCLQAHRQSPSPRHLRKHTRSQGPLLRRRYLASTLLRPCPTPAKAAACCDVEAATLARDGSPPITRITFPTCRAHYPGGSSGCLRRFFPARAAFPNWQEGRHPHCHFRGLLGLHSRYGPPDRSAAQGNLCHEAPALAVARTAARQLPDQSTTLWVESSSTSDARLRGALPIDDITPIRSLRRRDE
jgi:hypothetical protein